MGDETPNREVCNGGRFLVRPLAIVAQRGSASNANGIASSSPGLRGTSYPGYEIEAVATLKVVAALIRLMAPIRDATAFGVVLRTVFSQGSPSQTQGNPGLEDAIPLELSNFFRTVSFG